VLVVVFLCAPAGAQQAETGQNNNDKALEQKSQQLEQRLLDERAKLQEMQGELTALRNVIRSRQQTAGKTSGTSKQNTVTVKASSGTQPQASQSSQTASNGPGGTPAEVQASSTSRKTPAQSAAVQAAYQSQNALFRPGLTFYPQFQYAYTNSQNLVLNGFLAFNAIFLGNINVTRAETDVFEWNPQVFYALNRHFELDVNVPYIFERSTFKSVGANNSTASQSRATVSKWGLGDVSGGFYWQVMEQHKSWPSVIWNTQVSAPTGVSPFGIKLLTAPGNSNLKYPSNLPTGKGVWGVSSGFSIIRELDPVVLFGSGNFYYEFTQHANDVSTVPNQTLPGEVAPGNALSYTLGATTALNERLSLLVELQDIITNSTEIKPKGGNWTSIPDSSGNAAQFIFGATYAVNRNLFPFVQAGIGATQYSPNFQISLWVPYYFSY